VRIPQETHRHAPPPKKRGKKELNFIDFMSHGGVYKQNALYLLPLSIIIMDVGGGEKEDSY